MRGLPLRCRRGTARACAARSAAPCTGGCFRGHRCGRVRRISGEAGRWVWGETWNRAAWGARGGSGFPPSDFNHPSPAAFSLTEQSCSVPDLAFLLFEGVRSGTRRRRGPATSPQAAGVRGRDGPVQRPYATEQGLCGHCAKNGARLCGKPAEPDIPIRDISGRRIQD